MASTCASMLGYFRQRWDVLKSTKIVALLVGYDSEVDDCISHPLGCCSQRGTIGIVYTAPSVAGKWIWRLQVQDFVTHAPQSHDMFMSDPDLYARPHRSVVTIKQSAAQLTSVRPIYANVPTSPPKLVITSFFCNTRSPMCTSEPWCLTFPPKHAEKNLTDVRDWLCSTFDTNTSWAAKSEGDAMGDS